MHSSEGNEVAAPAADDLQSQVTPSPEDRRIAPRRQLHLQVEFESFDEFVSAYTLNVSRTGMFIPTEKFLPMGAVVSLDLALPEGGPKIKTLARVAYVLDAAKARDTGRVAGMGMEFLDVDGAPFADQISKYLDDKASSVSDQRRRKPRATVLVIDDSDSQRMAAIQCLRSSGFEVLSAADGLEGLGTAIRERPDVILSDVNMPRMDGWKLLRMIRARPNLANTPLIFLTTQSDDIARLKGYRLGVDDFLAKPFQGAELVARVERVLNRSRAQAGAGGNRALRGDLSQVALPSVLSLAEMERRTGSLLLVREDETITLLLREGAVVRIDLPARYADKKGIERFFHALSWTHGQFELSAIEVDARDELDLPISFVLLEHARRQDEGNGI
ncbi:MAG: response regulator [Deltaproteobacteria bacterium]